MLGRCNWVGFLLAVMVLCGGSAQAADERFAVEVAVDVSAANASIAREKAMSEANRAAITAVAKQISTPEGAAKLAAMTDDQLINFVKEVSVIDEKTSPVRYMANLQVVLNEAMLHEYMQERGIPLLVQNNARVLVVPIFREFASDRPLLWESNNLWREAWNQATATSAGAVQFVSLPTNAANYTLIDAAKAQSVDGEALAKLMQINGADDVYVLDAVYDGIEGLEIKATSYQGESMTLRVAGDRSLGTTLFHDAVAQTIANIESRLRQQNVSESAAEQQATVVCDVANLRQWVEIEQMLRAIPVVKNLEVQAMGTNKVQFKLTFVGSADKLVRALNLQGYHLAENGRYFHLQRLGE